MKTCHVCGKQYQQGDWQKHSQSLAHVRGSGRRK